MSIFVFCSQKSTGAKTLAESLSGVRLRNFDGMDFWVRGRKVAPKTGDLIVCWGGNLPEFDEGVKILNGKFPGNKFKSALLLQGGGVPTIKVATGRVGEDFLPRLNHHVGGDDLLKTPANPDFWVRKEALVREYRIHSFCGKSIRAGIKVLRDGFQLPTPNLSTAPPSTFVGARLAHPWIRSFDAGWKIDYDTFKSTSAMRGIAHKAVKVLGLDFGAVDLGEKADGSFVVLEVNRAPGIEGGSVEAYKRSIIRWLEEGAIKGEVKVEIPVQVPQPVAEAIVAQAATPPPPPTADTIQPLDPSPAYNRSFTRFMETMREQERMVERRRARLQPPTPPSQRSRQNW